MPENSRILKAKAYIACLRFLICFQRYRQTVTVAESLNLLVYLWKFSICSKNYTIRLKGGVFVNGQLSSHFQITTGRLAKATLLLTNSSTSVMDQVLNKTLLVHPFGIDSATRVLSDTDLVDDVVFVCKNLAWHQNCPGNTSICYKKKTSSTLVYLSAQIEI